MKTLFSFLFICALAACGSSKKSTETIDPTNERLVGIIHIDETCGALIHAKVGKNNLIIMPNNLDEKFKVEGIKVKFFFLNSSIPVPNGCKANARGNVEELTPLR